MNIYVLVYIYLGIERQNDWGRERDRRSEWDRERERETEIDR